MGIRRFILSSLITVLLIPLIGCVDKEIQTTETYYETEIKQEPYTANEQVEIKTPQYQSLFGIKDSSYSPKVFILFNKASDSIIKWSNELGDFSNIKSFLAESGSKNNRVVIDTANIAITKQIIPQKIYAGLILGRQPSAILKGFNFRSALQEIYVPRSQGSSLYPELGLRIIGDAYSSYGLTNVFNDIPIFGVNADGKKTVMTAHSYMDEVLKNLDKLGYFSLTGTSKVFKEVELKPSIQIEFNFSDMFSKDDWALIYIVSLPATIECDINLSVKYASDDVKTESRSVTKYKDVPIQIQKQRVVKQIKQVPFWEGLFSK